MTDLKIYMVQSVHPDPKSWRPDYDTTQSAVVVAESEQNAIDILRAAPRLEVPETGTPHPTKGWLIDVMTYPLEFDPECDFVAVELDITYKRVLHSHMHHG